MIFAPFPFVWFVRLSVFSWIVSQLVRRNTIHESTRMKKTVAKSSSESDFLADWKWMILLAVASLSANVYPASFLSFPAADFSRHSREQYSDNLEPGPIARSAGIQVPQATQRTSLFSVLIDPLRRAVELDALESTGPRIRLNTFRTIAI